MAENVKLFRDAALTDEFSKDKAMYESGYDPIWAADTFNATDGEGKNKVIYAQEIHVSNDYYYTSVQGSPIETGSNQRDPDDDAANEWHFYVAKPVEHAETAEAVGTGDDVETEFDLDNKWVKPGSETVKVGGTTQTRNTDYWICYKDGHIKFASAPGNGVAVTADYTHADDGTGDVDVPATGTIEANGDWTWTDLWDIPHGYDSNRGTGYEKDGIPIVIRGVVDAGTTDPSGNAVTLQAQDFKVKGWEHNAKY